MQRGRTGEGYIYYRDRSNGCDVTVYEHQLMALEYHSPYVVFDEEMEVDHLPPAPDANVPEFLHVVSAEENGRRAGAHSPRRARS